LDVFLHTIFAHLDNLEARRPNGLGRQIKGHGEATKVYLEEDGGPNGHGLGDSDELTVLKAEGHVGLDVNEVVLSASEGGQAKGRRERQEPFEG
jgi:hypothetical protein